MLQFFLPNICEAYFGFIYVHIQRHLKVLLNNTFYWNVINVHFIYDSSAGCYTQPVVRVWSISVIYGKLARKLAMTHKRHSESGHRLAAVGHRGCWCCCCFCCCRSSINKRENQFAIDSATVPGRSVRYRYSITTEANLTHLICDLALPHRCRNASL